MSAIATPSSLDELARYPGKAELINGRIVRQIPTGFRPSRLAFYICRLLDDYAQAHGRGYAFGDNTGFRVMRLNSERESFSPDAAYYEGQPPKNDMKFVPGPPSLAIEVRSEHDYGHSAEEAQAAKRTDYFEAGTLVVWDVDPLTNAFTGYRANDPDHGNIYRAGDIVDAEPALPGWKVAVSEIMNR